MINGWGEYRHMRVMDPDAAERGRLLTAHGMAVDPEGRKRVEDAIGVQACMQMYPEAYKSGWGRFLDKLFNPFISG